MPAGVAHLLGHAHRRERRDPLQAQRSRSGGGDEDAAIWRTVPAHRVDHPRDGGGFLPHRDIDADQVGGFLVDDGVHRDRGLADGAVADDQLALATAERKQRVDHQDAGLHRFRHKRAVDDIGRRLLDWRVTRGGDRRAIVQRPAKRIDHAAEQRGPDRDAHHVAGAAHLAAGADALLRVEQHAADAVAIQRLGEAELAGAEAE